MIENLFIYLDLSRYDMRKSVTILISFLLLNHVLSLIEFPIGKKEMDFDFNARSFEEDNMVVLPLGGGIPKAGLFYTTITVGGQDFKVIVVRL